MALGIGRSHFLMLRGIIIRIYTLVEKEREREEGRGGKESRIGRRNIYLQEIKRKRPGCCCFHLDSARNPNIKGSRELEPLAFELHSRR